MILYYNGIQIYLRKEQCIRLKYILCYSNEKIKYENLNYKLNDAIHSNRDIHLNLNEFRWIKENIILSKY